MEGMEFHEGKLEDRVLFLQLVKKSNIEQEMKSHLRLLNFLLFLRLYILER